MTKDRYRHGELYGLMAEFSSIEDLRAAAALVFDRGYRQVRIYAPYAIPDLAAMFGTMRSKVRKLIVSPIVFAGGVTGALGAIAMEEYANLVSYPINVGGRPLNSWPAFVPVVFELTILGASFAAVFAVLFLNRLPQFYHPVFNDGRFARATQDRYFLCVEDVDRQFDRETTRALLAKTAAVSIEEVTW